MTDRESRVIAIDGPAASGKSSTAAAVARALGLVHLDSGALYRLVTLIAIEGELDDAEAIVAAADLAEVAIEPGEGETMMLTRGSTIVGEEIRTSAVTARVSAVSAMPPVRDWVNRLLREAVAQAAGGVMDGRDIGSVVFPDAALKVFLTASPEARAYRRLRQTGDDVDPMSLSAEAVRLAERDRLDSMREVAPLRQAEGARLLDTSGMSFDEQVEIILDWAVEAGWNRGAGTGSGG